jgi:hypothetical protein
MKKHVLIMSGTTHYWMGELIDEDAWHYHLDKAAWVECIGRHHQVLATGKPDSNTEVEPHPDGMITRIPRAGSVVIDWPYPLWREAK